MLFALRVSLYDEPGMLGAVATALAHGGANIVSLDVVERGSGLAVDDICVEAPDGVAEALRRAAEDVPGAVVEAVRPVGAHLRVSSPLELAASLLDVPPGAALRRLIDGLPDAMWASWCAIVRKGDPEPQMVIAGRGCPSFTNVETPWLPLEAPRRLETAPWMPPAWRMGRFSYEIAAAPMETTEEAVVVTRRYGPRFRPAEVEQLGMLVRVATGLMRRFKDYELAS